MFFILFCKEISCILIVPLRSFFAIKMRVTKSAGNCGFGHIYWRNLNRKLHFLCSVDNEAILNYWPFRNTIFTFYKCDFVTFKLLNCLNQKSFISYKKRLNDKFIKMNWQHPDHVYFLFYSKEKIYLPRYHGCFS